LLHYILLTGALSGRHIFKGNIGTKSEFLLDSKQNFDKFF